ncbi:hypothetical protein GCM10008960_33220 [Deinococcus sedimenti]|uniref:Uncharacterized protein n=1 Tax=Deinococcus sedimenti TaxID=1867090 RepID=A0ABQ2S730_9DEIO|nr:hypothetical protein GCM10008960_33220 [Deinococcus sedimenti]
MGGHRQGPRDRDALTPGVSGPQERHRGLAVQPFEWEVQLPTQGRPDSCEGVQLGGFAARPDARVGEGIVRSALFMQIVDAREAGVTVRVSSLSGGPRRAGFRNRCR